MTLKFWGKLSSRSSLLATNNCFAQNVYVEAHVVNYLHKHRQLNAQSFEAGGQLFGLVSSDFITIKSISGPYQKDDRGLRHYRSDPASAQVQIKQQAKRGNIYLGEWHTHAEKTPIASSYDVEALALLMKNSILSLNGLLMLIVGQAHGEQGISIYSYMEEKFQRWDISSK